MWTAILPMSSLAAVPDTRACFPGASASWPWLSYRQPGDISECRFYVPSQSYTLTMVVVNASTSPTKCHSLKWFLTPNSDIN